MNLKLDQHLKNLPRVLDHEGGIAPRPTEATIDNVKKVLESLNSRFQSVLDPIECITASPTGTITIDWYHKKSFVCLEVGSEAFSYYGELPDGSLPYGNTLEALEKTLNAIYRK